MYDNVKPVRSNYRFSPELDKLITQKANMLKLSKNKLVIKILSEALSKDNQTVRNLKKENLG